MAKKMPDTNMGKPEILGELACTCALVRRSARRITQIYDAALQETGLRITQYSILANVDDRKDLSITDLAKLLAMDRTTLTRNLRPLQRDGLVELRDGPDKRSKALHLTANGREKLCVARPLWETTEASVRGVVTGDELTQLRSLLKRVTAPE